MCGIAGSFGPNNYEQLTTNDLVATGQTLFLIEGLMLMCQKYV